MTMRVYITRRTNLRKMRDFYDTDVNLAAWLGVTPSYICQLIGPNPTRPITEQSARAFEKKLSMRAGFLDEVRA